MSYRSDCWSVSPYNFIEGVRGAKPPGRVVIHDVTLRECDHVPGVILRKEERVRIAQALDELGIPRIEIGVLRLDGVEALKEILDSGLKAQVTVDVTTSGDIDVALKCGASRVLIGDTPSSDMIQKAFGMNREWVLNDYTERVSYAKDHGLEVLLFPPDGTRADLDFLLHLFKVGVEEMHADAVALVDTIGTALPETMTYMVNKIKGVVKAPLEVHCHNDYGLALANSLAAYRAGAEVIHTAINSLGYRCGNPSTDEVVVTLRACYGLDLGLNYGKLYEASKLVERLTGQAIAVNKPLVGDNAFTLEKADHLKAGIIPLLPEFIGTSTQIALGVNNDLAAIGMKLKELGFTATPKEVEVILDQVKKLSLERRRTLTITEFKGIVENVRAATS